MSLLSKFATATGTSDLQAESLFVNVIITILALAFMVYFIAFNPNLIGIALSSAALGGFLHEFLQSKGTIVFIQQRSDGLYLGSAAGFVFGMVSGVFIIQANVGGFYPPDTEKITRVFFEAFLAGLALKGAADAAAGNLKSKDEFQITALRLNVSVVDVSIKNDMQYTLTVQQITVTDEVTKQTYAPTANPPDNRIRPGTAASLKATYGTTFVVGRLYTIVIHTTNGKQEKTVTA